MIQLSLFGDDQKPTPAEREAQQLVGIQEWLHVWNDAERAMRLQATAFSAGITDSSGQTSRQLVRKC